MILRLRLIEEEPDNGENAGGSTTEHYHRRLSVEDENQAISRINLALDAEFGKPARKRRIDAGKARAS